MRTLVPIVETISIASPDPATLLFGLTRRRLLAWLLGHPDSSFYLRQLARQAGTAVGATKRELELLTAAGIVTRTVDGRQVYFQANRACPIFPELQSLFAKTAGLTDVIRTALEPLADHVYVAFIFGSAARGELRTGSDIDLMVVGTATFEQVVEAIADAQVRLGREINPTVYPTAEFTDKLSAGHHFLTRVLDEARLYVIGGDDELGRLGAQRLGDQPLDQRTRNPRPARRRRS